MNNIARVRYYFLHKTMERVILSEASAESKDLAQRVNYVILFVLYQCNSNNTLH